VYLWNRELLPRNGDENFVKQCVHTNDLWCVPCKVVLVGVKRVYMKRCARKNAMLVFDTSWDRYGAAR
jgi:hypothetical protein